MKKKNLKSLKLNKKSVSVLNEKQQTQIQGASLFYCGTEGLGCMLDTRGPNLGCHTNAGPDCARVTENNEYSCQCTIA